MRIKHTVVSIVIILMSSFLFSSCTNLPLPEELMRPPLGEENLSLDFNPDIYVPTGMELLTNANSGGRYKINLVDIDEHGSLEIVLFYGFPEKLECRGFVVLKHYDDWHVKYEEKYDENDRFNIENVDFEDINGTSGREMIVELSTYSGVSVFSIRTFNPEPVRMCLFSADRVNVIKQEQSNPLIAIWNYRDGGFDIDVIKWEHDGFIAADYDSPGYFANLIPSFEKALESEEEGLLPLADVLLKAGDYSKSLETISKFLKKEISNEMLLRALIIKARCQYNLGNIDEANKTIISTKLTQGYDSDHLIEAYILKADIMKHKGDVRGGGEALGNAEKLLYSYIRGDYRLHMWKTEIDRRLIATDEFKP